MPKAKDSQQWYTRPVVFVTDVEHSLDYYTNALGFTQAWNHQENGRDIVAQVNRGDGCELILSEDKARAGKSRVFISLDSSDLVAFQTELENKAVNLEQSWWGYPVLLVKDSDGNEMMFPFEQQS